MLLRLPPEIVLEIVDAALLISPLTFLALVSTTKSLYNTYIHRPAHYYSLLPHPSRFQQAFFFDLHRTIRGPVQLPSTSQPGGNRNQQLLAAAQAYERILEERAWTNPPGTDKVAKAFAVYRRVTRFVSILVDDFQTGRLAFRLREQVALDEGRGGGEMVRYAPAPGGRTYALPAGVHSLPPEGLGLALLRAWVREELAGPQGYTPAEEVFTSTIFLALISLSTKACFACTPRYTRRASIRNLGTEIDFDPLAISKSVRHSRAAFVGKLVRAVFTVAVWEKVIKGIDGRLRSKVLELIFRSAKDEGGVDWEDWGLWLVISNDFGRDDSASSKHNR